MLENPEDACHKLSEILNMDSISSKTMNWKFGNNQLHERKELKVVFIFERRNTTQFRFPPHAYTQTLRQATGPLRQATGPPRSGAGVEVGMLRGTGTT